MNPMNFLRALIAVAAVLTFAKCSPPPANKAGVLLVCKTDPQVTLWSQVPGKEYYYCACVTNADCGGKNNELKEKCLDNGCVPRKGVAGEACSVQADCESGFNCTNGACTPSGTNNTANDKDGDGVIDAKDKCPDVAGPVINEGCPQTQNNDRDNDGILNNADSCPDVAGPAANLGCPEIACAIGSTPAQQTPPRTSCQADCSDPRITACPAGQSKKITGSVCACVTDTPGSCDSQTNPCSAGSTCIAGSCVAYPNCDSTCTSGQFCDWVTPNLGSGPTMCRAYQGAKLTNKSGSAKQVKWGYTPLVPNNETDATIANGSSVGSASYTGVYLNYTDPVWREMVLSECQADWTCTGQKGRLAPVSVTSGGKACECRQDSGENK